MTVTDTIQSAAPLHAPPPSPFALVQLDHGWLADNFSAVHHLDAASLWCIIYSEAAGWMQPLIWLLYIRWEFACDWLGASSMGNNAFFSLKPITLHKHTHPLKHTHTHSLISVATNSNNNWMLNKAACWIIKDLRPGQVLISIQTLWT